MISVNFTADVENIVATEHLYQWDNGQKLSISGVGITTDIHFANKKSEKALVVTPTVTSGACVVSIPNSLLAEPYPIIAYVCVPSDDGARTIKSVTIYVEARKQPSDFVLEDDEGITTLETISQRANEVLQNATNQVNTAVSNMLTDYNAFKTSEEEKLNEAISQSKLGDATTFQSKYPSDFIQYIGFVTAEIANNTNYSTSYEGVISEEVANSIGLPQNYYHFKNFKFVYDNWNYQLAFPFNFGAPENSKLPIYRSAYLLDNNWVWTAWTPFADGGNANSVNGVTFLVGTATPQTTDPNAEGYVPEGAWYGQYEAETT